MIIPKITEIVVTKYRDLNYQICTKFDFDFYKQSDYIEH